MDIQNKTIINNEVIEKYSKIILKRMFYPYTFIFSFITMIGILGYVLWLSEFDPSYLVVFILFGFIYLMTTIFYPRILRYSYKNSLYFKYQSVVEFDFLDFFVDIKSTRNNYLNNEKINYADLFSVEETNDFILLYKKMNLPIIVDKTHFTMGSANQLRKLLQEKCRNYRLKIKKS